MKKLYLLFFLFFTVGVRAQWVSIPDTNFGTWLSNSWGHAQCLQGNSTIGWQLDTTCFNVQNETDISCFNRSIRDLTGITYFDNLRNLDCKGNLLSSLPILPAGLTSLNCYDNQISSLPPLPIGLASFSCFDNLLTSLPSLPVGITLFRCYKNLLSSLPALPMGITRLDCYENQLGNLPPLPAGLTWLDCDKNQLSSLPTLPATLTRLSCAYNQLTSLPPLPAGLTYLATHSNNLSSLPELPDSLSYCYVGLNPLNCLPRLKRINNLNFFTTNISCIPNRGNVSISNPSLSSLPVCDLWNTNSCEAYWNISGTVYLDPNNNCLVDSGERGITNVPVRLLNNGTLLQQMPTQVSGAFSFETDTGSYEIRIDTADLPFYVHCPANNLLYSSISVPDSLDYNKDFSLHCKSGFDLAAWSIHGWRFRPGNFTTVAIHTGDLSNFYGVHCASGVSGAVTVTITGAVTYVSPASGALTPSVSGNVLTYNVSDFGNTNFNTDFNIIVQTDTNAVLGSQVCFTVTVTPIAGDNNPANNTLTHCFTVIGSFDPNDKQVSPAIEVVPSGWLTYTVNFQNTGTDTAQHIYITDTLDADLDEATFQLLAYSVQPMVQIIANAVRFNFPNINLPDSNVNEPASHGYVQYKIKLKDNLPIGTPVNNTAFIYFDFNAPVVTNTVTNFIQCPTGTTILSTEICDYESYLFNGVLLNSSGTYMDTLTDVNGCDSVIKLTLTVLPALVRNISATICANEQYSFGGMQLSIPGVYFDSLTNPSGCDSVIVLTLTVLATSFTGIGDGVCENTLYNFNGVLLSDPGLYYDTLTNINGCDSIVALTLYSFSSSLTTLTQNICGGDTFYFGGSALTSDGTYSDTLQNVQGCDSVVQLMLSVLPDYVLTVDTAIVQGSTYTLPTGSTVNTAGTYSDTLLTDEGCDSIIVTNLSVVSGVGKLRIADWGFRIYPNPASNSITISIDERMIGAIASITDMTGRKMKAVQLSLINNPISINDFPAGVYVVEVTSKSNVASASRKRFVKL